MAGVLAAAIAMEDLPGLYIGIAPPPGHLQRIHDQMAAHLRLHRPAHNPATEQVDDHGQKQPALVGWNVGDVACPRLVGRGHGGVAVQQVGGDRQTMSAIGGDAETPLAASANTVLPHQLLHPLLAPADTLSTQFAPDARPAVSSAIGRIHGANLHHQCFRAQVPTPSGLQTNKVLMIASHALPRASGAARGSATHTPMASNQGVLHFCPLAKYAIAFPRMSRSMVTRASSARRRLISICSAGYLRPAVGPPSACLPDEP